MNVIILDKTFIDAIQRIAKKRNISETDALEVVMKIGINSIFIRDGLHNKDYVNEEGRWEYNSSLI